MAIIGTGNRWVALAAAAALSLAAGGALAQSQKSGIISADEITKTLAPQEQPAGEAGSTGKVRMRGLNFRGIGKVKRKKKGDEAAAAPKVPATAQISIPILFKTNSAEIDLKALPQLEQIAKALNTKTLSKYLIVLEGHTDSVGAENYNLDLSRRRADSVMAHLVRKGDVAHGRITAIGKGENEPVASNATARGREMNRRVTIIRKGVSE